MKKIVLLISLMLAAVMGQSQTNVMLKINHKLGTEDFAYGTVASNNLGHEFKAERLEYYLTQITIVHDGGTETAVPLEVVALVQPGEEVSTSIALGSYDVTAIESVKFYIGVYEPINNQDPTLFPVDHPLGPKSPSMHWGWTAGYRFIAYEGVGGVGFSQMFQMHGLGNENYFQVTSEVDVEEVGGSLVMNINGNYAAGLNDIDLAAGTISHGTTGAAKKVLENWRDLVFGLYYVGIEETATHVNWSVFPNPSNGMVTVQFDEKTAIHHLQIVNPLGEIVQTIATNNQQKFDLNLSQSGVYFIIALNDVGETIATERVLIK